MKTRSSALAIALLASTALAQDGDELQFHPRTQNQSATSGGIATVIYSNVSGLPTAAVPGLPFEFNAGSSSTSAFDRPFGSPNGNWVLTALMETGSTTDDEIILVNDAVEAREGDVTTWAPGEAYGTFDTRVQVNDTGQWSFTTNTDGPTTADDYVVRGDGGGAFTVIAKEGDPISALPGNTWDDALENSVLLFDGTVGFTADGIDGTVTSGEDELLALGAGILAQEGTTIPSGQAGGAMETWENFDLNDYYVTHDGAHWLAQGDLSGSTSTDDIVAYDGAVVLQEGSVIPGSGFADPIDLSGIVGCWLDHGGNWYARGNNDVTEQDWVVRNGAVIAAVGDPITGTTAEAWSDAEFGDCFFLHVGNTVGDWVIGGVTDGPTETNGVLVLNGTDVLCREGDPVDLDGNGAFDDDAFVNTFGNDDAFLLDDGTLYVVATIRDMAGVAYAQAFMKLEPDTGPTALCFGDGSGTPCPCGNTGGAGEGCANSTGSGATIAASGSLSVGADDLEIAAAGLLPDQPCVLCSGENSINGGAGDPFGDGLRCVGTNVVRLGVRVPDMAGAASWGPGLGAIGGWTAGDTRYIQCWYRDPMASPCGSTFNLTHSLAATFQM